MDLNTISVAKINMAGYEASIAVWIPLIVGLAPGLVTGLQLLECEREDNLLTNSFYLFSIFT